MSAATILDQVTLQLAEANPEALYREAAFFDDVADLLRDVTDGFRSVMRKVEESWLRYEAGGAAPTLGATSARVLTVLRELQADDTGSLLRSAGDSLARARVELRDLQQQRAQDAGNAAGSALGASTVHDAQASLVLTRVSRDFIEVGTNLPALPERTASGGALTLAAAPPAPMLSLASAPLSADDPSKTQIPDRTGGGAPVSGSSSPLAASAFDTTNPSSPPGGQPMMPFMPMGMGMGMGAQPNTRERPAGAHAAADPSTWREPDDGWEVLGRRPPPAGQSERAAVDAIDDLIRQRLRGQ